MMTDRITHTQSEKKGKVTRSSPTLCDPRDYTVHGILQASVLEWVDIPSPGDLPNPGIEPRSPVLQADSLPAEPQGEPIHKTGLLLNIYIFLSDWVNKYSKNLVKMKSFSVVVSKLFNGKIRIIWPVTTGVWTGAKSYKGKGMNESRSVQCIKGFKGKRGNG